MKVFGVQAAITRLNRWKVVHLSSYPNVNFKTRNCRYRTGKDVWKQAFKGAIWYKVGTVAEFRAVNRHQKFSG